MLVPTEDHPGSGYRNAVLIARVFGYLNSFRMALPVAFPATRRPTRWKSTGLFVGEGRFPALGRERS